MWQALSTLAESRAEAVPLLRKLISVAPDHRRGRLALRDALVEDAREFVAAGQAPEACERWREALAVSGGDVEVWLGLAATTANAEEATRAYETAYELDPLDERAVAAMDRLRGPQLDPTTAAVPDDAFLRFEAPDGTLAPFDIANDSLDSGDSLMDAFARLAEAPAPQATVTALPAVIVAEPAVSEVAVRSRGGRSRGPAAEVAATAPPPLTAAAAVPDLPVPQRPASSKRTVMVVDDSPTIRKILGLTLERAGYGVLAEASGESALERMGQTVPDLVLLDISMPGLDGYEVCKRIKQDPRTSNVPVIMLSGKGAFFDTVKGKMAGATEYLPGRSKHRRSSRW